MLWPNTHSHVFSLKIFVLMNVKLWCTLGDNLKNSNPLIINQVWFPYSVVPSSNDFQRYYVVTLTKADLRFKKQVNTCCSLVLSSMQFSVIVDFYFMNFT